MVKTKTGFTRASGIISLIFCIIFLLALLSIVGFNVIIVGFFALMFPSTSEQAIGLFNQGVFNFISQGAVFAFIASIPLVIINFIISIALIKNGSLNPYEYTRKTFIFVFRVVMQLALAVTFLVFALSVVNFLSFEFSSSEYGGVPTLLFAASLTSSVIFFVCAVFIITDIVRNFKAKKLLPPEEGDDDNLQKETRTVKSTTLEIKPETTENKATYNTIQSHADTEPPKSK